MKVRLLGTAAGGGLPQWNCACAGCVAARRAGVNRTQDCLAVTGDGSAWYLVNASPDLRTQLIAAPELAPGPGLRDTPVRGVLCSTGELDHTLGLITLREAASLQIYATAPVRAALEGPFPAGPILSRYTTVEWHDVVPGAWMNLDGGLRSSYPGQQGSATLPFQCPDKTKPNTHSFTLTVKGHAGATKTVTATAKPNP